MSQASITECNTANDAANALLNGGTIEIKSGAEPDIDGAISGTILETFVIPATAFGASANRIATMTTIAAIVAVSVGSGTPQQQQQQQQQQSRQHHWRQDPYWQ